MSQKHYERYLNSGPDALPLEDVKAALDWRDQHQAEAFRVRRAFIRQQKEQQELDDLVAVAVMNGHDEREARAEARKLVAEQRAAAIREMDRGVKEADARRAWGGF